MKSLSDFSPEPEVRLVNAFNLPYDNAVATARTCYSSSVVYAEDVNKDAAARQKRDAIARSIYLAGHHTTLQHASFQFVIERVSRQCIWSFLHSHPFYNSEQVSQRYVSVSPSNFSVPRLPECSRPFYLETIQLLMQAYQKLQELLRPTAEKEFQNIFPFRNLAEKRWQGSVRKKCQEIARYLLPVATHAHLYHTISGITLLRYLRLCENFDAPAEQGMLVRKMAAAVQKWDPEFLKNAEDPIPIEETPEYRFFANQSDSKPADPAAFIAEFDQSLAHFSSLLVDYKIHSEKVMANSVRNILGLPSSELDDDSAIELALDPAQNFLLSETLNLTHHSKLSRAMLHPHFTFRKKISHTADSQDQRHRTVPGSRPILSRHFSPRPDFVTPQLIQITPSAKEFYLQVMDELWKRMQRVLNDPAPIESVLYLLPNAFPIRFEESGTLLDFHHKWVHRLCYTAQEEIWKNSLEEVIQIEKIFPRLAAYLRPPCSLRQMAQRKPFCPEGERFCGVPVWKLPLQAYERTL